MKKACYLNKINFKNITFTTANYFINVVIVTFYIFKLGFAKIQQFRIQNPDNDLREIIVFIIK